MYKIASVPTAVVAEIQVQEIIPITATSLLSGVSVTGFAFNSAGEAFLTTGSTDKKVFKMINAASTPTLVATLAEDNIGADLTSCNLPMLVLPSTWSKFTAELRNGIQLKWSATEEPTVTGYNIEYSADGEHWKALDFVERKTYNSARTAEYNYTDQQYVSGNNYYRIQQAHQSGKKTLSSIKLVTTKLNSKIFIGPNPAKDVLHIQIKNHLANYQAQIFDEYGRLISSTVMSPFNHSINISKFQKGTYILKLISTSEDKISVHQFVKW